MVTYRKPYIWRHINSADERQSVLFNDTVNYWAYLASVGKLNMITDIRRDDTDRSKPKYFVRSCLRTTISTANTTSTVLACRHACRAETPRNKGSCNGSHAAVSRSNDWGYYTLLASGKTSLADVINEEDMWNISLWLLTNEKPTWCHLLFYFTYYALNLFRTLIYPSSGACDCVDELPHPSSCSVKTDVLAISVPLRCVVVCLVWCVLSPCCSW